MIFIFKESIFTNQNIKILELINQNWTIHFIFLKMISVTLLFFLNRISRRPILKPLVLIGSPWAEYNMYVWNRPFWLVLRTSTITYVLIYLL